MLYLIMKTFHIIFAVLFLGNIITVIFWKIYADKSRDKKFISHTLKGIIKADRIFTMPGVLGILIFGFGAQGVGGYSITTGWIFWSLILILISGIAFMAKVSPIQKRMLALADSPEFNEEEYKKSSDQWMLWGLIATLTPIIAVILMVLKIPY